MPAQYSDPLKEELPVNRGLDYLRQWDKRQLFRLFVDGRFHKKYRGWLGYEEKETGSVQAMLDGFTCVLENFDLSAGLSSHYLEVLHHSCLYNVYSRTRHSTPGEIRIRSGGMPLFKKSTTLANIEELLEIRRGDNTLVFNTGEFAKKAEELDANSLYAALQTRGRLSYRPWHPVLDNRTKSVLARKGSLSDYYSAKNFIRQSYIVKIELILDEYNQAISLASEDAHKISAIAKLVRDLELLHPFQDGNCRTFACALLNHLLLFHGFPPAIQANPNLDGEVSYEEFESEIYQGMSRARALLEDKDQAMFKFSILEMSEQDNLRFLQMAEPFIQKLEELLTKEEVNATLAESSIDTAPPTISAYKIVKPLGKGTNARVYLAEDKEASGNSVVLKHYVRTAAPEKFTNELAALKQLNAYPNAIRMLEYQKLEPGAYLVFENVNAMRLQHHIQKNGPLTEDECVNMVLDVASTIDFMNEKGFLHLDIMASNVLYNGERFFLNDWGDTQRGPVAPTLSTKFNKLYMPPELYLGKRDIRSEIYSLGCVLYYVASSRSINSMFNLASTSEAQKIYAHIYKRPQFTDQISPFLRKLIGHMVQKQPQNRPSIDELRSYISQRTLPDLVPDRLKGEDLRLTATLDIYRQMAKDNIAHGLYKMGLFYEKGYHLNKDRDLAIENYEQASTLDYTAANHRLALITKKTD